MNPKIYMIFLILIALFTGCATRSLKTAAEKGDPVAQYKLGFNYETGIDVPQRDFKKALYWYGLSANNGNYMAKSNLYRLEQSLGQGSAANASQNVTTDTWKSANYSPAAKPSQTSSATGSISNTETLVRDVSVKLSNIDDLGLVYVQNSDGKITLAEKAEWVFGSAGVGTASLNKYLKYGTNLVIFVLHNKSFRYGIGKWSYNFSFIGDGTLLWNIHNEQRGGDVGIRAWQAFSVEGRPNGLFSVSPATQNQIDLLGPIIANFDNDLKKNYGHENSSDFAALGIALGTFALMSSSGSNESNGSYSNDDSANRRQLDSDREQQRQEAARDQLDKERQRQEEVRDRQRQEESRTPYAPGFREAYSTDGIH